MVADDYFDLRSRLGAALFSLGRLSDQAGLKPTRANVVKGLVESLREPFVFVVAGEVNSGKSTLLNALFGEEFCPAGVLPETRRIHYFRYGRTARRVSVNEMLEDVELPHAFLRDFHVVDTPGVNSIEKGHELITGDIIPKADAVLYCFPATNPWSEAAWAFLERIHRDWLKKTVLVLQQADLRTPDEVIAISEHMRNIARQRLGADLPVYPVAARLALLARTTGVDKPRLLAASAFPAMENLLTTMCAGAPPRLGRLVNACSAGQAMLAEVQSRLAGAAASLAELMQTRETARGLVAATGGRIAATVPAQARQLRAAWDRLTNDALRQSLAARCPFPALLWTRDPTVDTVESRLLPPLMAAVHETAAATDQTLNETLTSLWKQPGSSIHRSLEGRVRREPEPAWPERRKLFTTTLENAGCEAVSQSGLAEFWQSRLLRRRQIMRGFAGLSALILLAVLAAAATGSLPAAGALWAVILLAAGAFGARLTLRREAAETAALATPLLTVSGDQFEREAASLLLTHTQRRLADFSPLLEPLDHAIQQRRLAAAPLEAETGQLAQTLQILGRSLHAGVAWHQ
jgi:GTPase SAR1 family protein